MTVINLGFATILGLNAEEQQGAFLLFIVVTAIYHIVSTAVKSATPGGVEIFRLTFRRGRAPEVPARPAVLVVDETGRLVDGRRTVVRPDRAERSGLAGVPGHAGRAGDQPQGVVGLGGPIDRLVAGAERESGIEQGELGVSAALRIALRHES